MQGLGVWIKQPVKPLHIEGHSIAWSLSKNCALIRIPFLRAQTQMGGQQSQISASWLRQNATTLSQSK